MIFKPIALLRMLFVVLLLVLGIAGCNDGECDAEYDTCLSRMEGTASKYTYEETCRYPSMNRGDQKIFCDCEDAYQKCTRQN